MRKSEKTIDLETEIIDPLSSDYLKESADKISLSLDEFEDMYRKINYKNAHAAENYVRSESKILENNHVN